MFAYCANNPSAYFDSNGKNPLVIGIVVGALIGAVVGAISCAISNKGTASISEVLVAALVGAVCGGAAACGTPGIILAAVIAGAYTAITTDGSWYQKLISGLISAGFTYIAGGKADAWSKELLETQGIDSLSYGLGIAFSNFITGESADLLSLATRQVLDSLLEASPVSVTSQTGPASVPSGGLACSSRFTAVCCF